jgi:hypothetical protein
MNFVKGAAKWPDWLAAGWAISATWPQDRHRDNHLTHIARGSE